MEFETIKKNKTKQIVIGGICALGIASALVYLPSRAKYRTTESFNIVNGTINYKVPDFNIVAMYSSEDGENYTELTGRMPSSRYAINESKSYCNLNGSKDTSVKLYTENTKHNFENLQKGDKCYLYFDKVKITNSTELIANSKINTYSPDFSQVATTDEGIYQIPDGMYSGTSYYYRGAVDNNYVKFAGFCWRIIRINGDGTIRMIYDGESCHQNGEATAESIAVTSQAYNSSYNASYYVGYTYEEGLQRPSDNATATASNLKTQTDSWYKTNITDKGYDGKVADGKFCNDRNTASDSTWAASPSSTFYYAAQGRLESAKASTLACDKDDVYKLKIGAITADEVSFAGGVYGTANDQYYLYNGQYYWTMSPYWWSSSNHWVVAFSVYDNGQLWNIRVNNTTPGVRPVINLRADTVFPSGDGTIDSPYIVQ